MEQKENKYNTELTREEKLEIEERAIQALLDMGVKFSVPLRIKPVDESAWIRWWNKRNPSNPVIRRDRRIPKGWDVSIDEIPDTTQHKMEKVYMRHFYIKPLYLGTIDYIRKLYLNIEYDEEKIQEQPIQESKKLFKYIRTVSEIAAVAVINDPSVTDSGNRNVMELSKFFVQHLTVSRLMQLSTVISQMMNAGGFTSSIRSIREIGTTKPAPREGLIEKKDSLQG